MTRSGDGGPTGFLGLRRLAIVVFIALSALIVVASIAGRPVSDVLSGAVMGTLIALLGLEGLNAVVKR